MFFNQSIIHSGSGHSFWAISDDRPIIASEGISDEISCGEFDSKPQKESALDCLRNKSLAHLVKYSANVEKILDVSGNVLLFWSI